MASKIGRAAFTLGRQVWPAEAATRGGPSIAGPLLEPRRALGNRRFGALAGQLADLQPHLSDVSAVVHRQAPPDGAQAAAPLTLPPGLGRPLDRIGHLGPHAYIFPGRLSGGATAVDPGRGPVGPPLLASDFARVPARGPNGQRVLQRACACGTRSDHTGECEECKQRHSEELQRAASGTAPEVVPPVVDEVLRMPGQPLDDTTRVRMEARFREDFSRVRVHTDARAAQSARAVNALAYTVGEHIVFGFGQYAPLTHAGQRLAAHELAHVVQQSRGVTNPVSPTQTDHLEREAHVAAVTIDGGMTPVGVKASGPPRIARTPGPGQGAVPTLRTHGLTASEINLLNQVRGRLVPANERSTAIVGVLIAEDGRTFEFRSGGGQGFSSHVEGKATAKMEELGITKATLLVEKEPCQICDRSVYPREGGPETPLRSSRTGAELSRQTPKINTALPVGSELIVVDPESASVYRGVKAVSAPKPPKPAGRGKQPETGPAEGGTTAKPEAEGGLPEAGTTPKPRSGPGAASRTGAVPKPGGTTAVTGEAAGEARLAARAAAGEISADFKILRVAKGLNAALHIAGFISALLTLDSFTSMTLNALAGKGFILTKEIAEAESLQTRSAELKRDYLPFSDKLTEKQLKFLRSAGDPLAAGQTASSISDLETNLGILRRDLAAQITRVNAARREAEAKQKAAEAILNDPKASAAIAAATFGTAELAQLFAASQDMQRIAGALRGASADLTEVQSRVDGDFEFIHGWFEALFEICRKGGQCSLTVIEIPFVGTSRVHGLPGEAN